MDTKEMIEVMQHYDNGGRVQSAPMIAGYIEYTEVKTHLFNFMGKVYRIHPEEQAIIDHFNNGGEVECQSHKINGWFMVHKENGEFHWGKNEYRIKTKHINSFPEDISPKMSTNIGQTSTNIGQIEVPEGHNIGDRHTIFSGDGAKVLGAKQDEIINCLNQIKERLDGNK